MDTTIILGSTRVCHLKPESRIKKTRLKLAKLKLRSAQSIYIMRVSCWLFLCCGTYVFLLVGLGQKSSELCILLCPNGQKTNFTGKSFSEALILASTNPQYDKRLFIDLPVQYMKTTSSEHLVYINCSECQNKNKKQFVYTTCSDLFMY